MKRITIAALAAALLGACAAHPQAVNVAGDHYGNIYPADCRKDWSQDAAFMSHVSIKMIDLGQTDTGGHTYPARNGRAYVILNTRYSGWVLEDHRQHELVHAAGELGFCSTAWPRHHDPAR